MPGRLTRDQLATARPAADHILDDLRDLMREIARLTADLQLARSEIAALREMLREDQDAQDPPLDDPFAGTNCRLDCGYCGRCS